MEKRRFSGKRRSRGGNGKLLLSPFAVLLICIGFIWLASLETPRKEVLGETPVQGREDAENTEPTGSAEPHKVSYTDITEITSKNPLLVNKSNKLPDDFVPGNLVEIVNGHMATPQTKEAYTRMRRDAIADGLIFDVASAYRSIDRQRTIYNKAVAEEGTESADLQIARPGHSEHHTGRAMDITGSFGLLEDFERTPEAAWVAEHAYEYGFIIRYGADNEDITGYSYEPWHITYVGTEIAQKMKSENIKTLEEYVESVTGFTNEFYEDGSRTVVIDAGHGGEDSGCIWGGIEEKNVNLEIAENLKKMLEAKGYRVVMTRSGDDFPSKLQRVETANAYNAAAFVSIHQNAYEQTDIFGIETWYDDTDPDKDSFNLARLVHRETVLATGAADRGLQPDSELFVTRETDMPSCLVETGYMSNNNERALLNDGDYQTKIARGIAEGVDLFLTPKVMYLTFDDGPSAKTTPLILDVLKERGIKATFFVVGENVRKNPELARRIVEEGHTIGIHCDSHVYKDIYASVDSYAADFNKAYDAVVEVTGVRPEIFRFPGGSVNDFNKKTYRDIINEMTGRGFVYFDWNACIDDAVNKTGTADLVENARISAAGKDRVVMLAHDTVSQTAESLNDILDLFSDYHMAVLTSDTKQVRFSLDRK